MISVSEARDALLALVDPLAAETVPLVAVRGSRAGRTRLGTARSAAVFGLGHGWLCGQ